jgi:aspartate aminotransferase-like enzyme
VALSWWCEEHVTRVRRDTPLCLLCLLCCAVLGDYWGWWKPARSYHHTGPVSTFYALREALAIVGEEGLQGMWDRHLQVSQP